MGFDAFGGRDLGLGIKGPLCARDVATVCASWDAIKFR